METKLGQMEFAFSSIGEELGKKWGTAFSKSTVKLLTHATKPLIKTLFNSFMRGTGEENLFGGDIVGKLISAVKLYTTFCEGELAQLEEEYKAHQKGLHAQLQIDRTMAYFLGRIVQACGDNGLERLGRNLINTRCPPTACLYKPGVMLHRPEQLQQRLLHEQHGRPHSSWGPNEQLVGPAVFLRGLPLFVNGTLLNNGGTNTDLLLSLAAQIGLRAEGDSDKEALAEAVVGSLIVKKFALAKAGQQTALTDESLARLRGDPVELLKVFASLHGKQVDVFVAEGKQVVAIYRISPPSVSALSASYKVCWSREEGFGPATLERQAPTQRRVRFAEG